MAYSEAAADRLTEVRAAIGRCLTSQSYSIAGRNQVMAQLSTLRQMERELMEETSNSSSNGSMCSLGIQMEPSQ